MNFVCVVFELRDKMLTLSSMENLIVPCNQEDLLISGSIHGSLGAFKKWCWMAKP